MPNNIRCKFVCQSITKTLHTVRSEETNEYERKPLFNAEFSIVAGGSEENKKFFQWTPLGLLKLGLYRDDAFEIGKEYYIDITEALPEQPT